MTTRAKGRTLLSMSGDEVIREIDGSATAARYTTTWSSVQTAPVIESTSANSLAGPGGIDAQISGTSGNDVLEGTAQNDTIDGLAGNDTLRGFGGNDTLNGGDDNDLVIGGLGDDNLDGGSGTNRAGYYHTDSGLGGVTVDLRIVGIAQNTGSQGWDTLVNIRNVSGTPFADTLTGDSGDNWIWGAASTISVGNVSASNNDTLDGGSGNDNFWVGIGNHTLIGGDGIDTLRFTENGGAETGVTISLALQGAAQVTGNGSWTLTGIENLSGSVVNDTLTGDGNANVLAGDLGNDTLIGGGGNDTILGDGLLWVSNSQVVTTFNDAGLEGGDDTLEGGEGDDTLYGGAGNDSLRGGLGNDLVYGGAGNDFMSESSGENGPFGNDTYDGGDGSDRVSYFISDSGVGATVNLNVTTAQNTGQGSDTILNIEHVTSTYFNDTLTGNSADNWFWTFAGSDVLSGNGGNDYFTVGAGDKIIDGGTGFDTVDMSDESFAQVYAGAGGINVSLLLQGSSQAVGTGLWTLTGIEDLGGYYLNDTLTGDGNNNVLAGDLGNDTLNGGGGDDRLHGDGYFYFSTEAGSLVVNTLGDGPGGDDTLNGGSGNDTLNGGGGDDFLNGGADNDTADGGDGDDFVQGAGGNDVLAGGDGDDVVFGGAGTDQVSGNAGNDVLRGGAGVDSFDGGTGGEGLGQSGYGDRISFFEDSATAGVVADLRTGIISNDGFGNAETMTGIESLGGDTAFVDTFHGNDGSNVIFGNRGDTLYAYGGDDYISVTSAAAIADGGNGIDLLSVSSSGGWLSPDANADGFAEIVAAASNGWTVNLAAGTLVDGYGNNGTVAGIEKIEGTELSDTVTGDNVSNVLAGFLGSDTLIGGGGDDTLSGDGIFEVDGTELSLIDASDFDPGGNDTLEGGLGNDTLMGGGGIDTATYANATSAVTVSLVAGTASGGDGNDTLSDFENVTGSAFSDAIWGNDGGNVLNGGDGNDTIRAGEGDDFVYGGEGADFLSQTLGVFPAATSTYGNDYYDGGAGSDRVTLFTTTGPGVTVNLNITTAQNTGAAGMDTFIGIEHITATFGDDTLTGTSDANFFWTFGGSDTLTAAGGDDYFIVGRDNKVISGGSGVDTVMIQDDAFVPSYTADGITVSLLLQGSSQAVGTGNWTLTGIENLSGDYGSDDFTGDANANVLAGQLGDDVLRGGGGNDILSGDGYFGWDFTTNTQIFLADSGVDGGSDTLDGGLGNDTLNGGAGVDTATYASATGGVTVDLGLGTATGAAGNDTLSGIENVTGSGFNDLLWGDGGANLLSGGAGFDQLRGDAGNDILDGGDSADLLVGGLGNDTINGGAGNDRAGYYQTDSSLGGVTVSLTKVGAQNVGSQGNDTLTGIEHVSGTPFADVLTGDAGSNWLWGAAATISAGNVSATNNDQLNGGAGNDLLVVGIGNHSVIGGADVDTIRFTENGSAEGNLTLALNTTLAQNTGNGTWTISGIENVSGGIMDDLLTGNNIDNVLAGDKGADTLVGNGGNDTLLGDGFINVDVNLAIATTNDQAAGGNDTLDGGAGNDILLGGTGDDTLKGGVGDDNLDGGTGNDTASYADATAAVTVSLAVAGAQDTVSAGIDTLTGIENLTGSNYADTLTGATSANLLNGGGGADRLDGAGGIDVLDGGVGGDELIGGGGNDILIGGSGSGVDALKGGVGDDAMTGGQGSDTYYVDSLGDTTVENLNEGQDLVVSSISWTLAANTEDLTLTGTAAVGTGNDLVNAITGNNANNQLYGLDGNDTLTGAGGNDTLEGGNANDTLSGGDGLDTLLGGDGTDTLNGGTGNDVLEGGLGRDLLTGGTGADQFLFRTGDTGNTQSSADKITDFSAAQADKIDLSFIDANSSLADDQAFSFIGTAAFSNVAGELRYAQTAADTFVYGDTNGDGTADLVIRLAGAQTLTSTDFTL